MAAMRSPQEIFGHHAQALGAEDLLEWGAEGGGNRVEDGIDTFVFRDGLIRVQTVRYTLRSAG
jgi:hypothetical protein